MHYWNMYPFIGLPNVLRADPSKTLPCSLQLPLILIVSYLPKVWPEVCRRVARASSQA